MGKTSLSSFMNAMIIMAVGLGFSRRIMALGAVFSLTTCSFHEQKKDLPDGEVVDGTTLNFTGITAAVFRPRCLSCHSDQNRNGGLSLEDFQEVRSKAQKIKLRAVTQRSMPPNARLGDNNAATLGQWIDAGTPN